MAQWISRHWWSRHFDLTSKGRIIASVRIKGSRGTADIEKRRYALARTRWPPYITIRDPGTDELIARLDLIPKHGFLVEFDDAESFRLTLMNWWKREWNWTSDSGEPLLSSRQSWFGNPIEVRFESAVGVQMKWPLLAVLELAMAQLAVPWF